jgi:hypothetical protein
LIAGAVSITAAVAVLALLTRSDEPPPRPLSRLEREASARFAGSRPYVSLPDGKRLDPTSPAHVLQMKVNAYQRILADEEEQRDPTFHLKAEAELERRRPLTAAIEWNDVTGNREMDFTIEDSSTCALDSRTELTVAVEDVTRYPCLAQGGTFWEPGTQLTVHLTPVTRDDHLWGELLHSTKKALATAAHLASGEASQGS